VRQGELQLSKQFFLLRHSLQRVATRQGELWQNQKNLNFHLSICFIGVYS
jgi:hypothetical protein